MAERVLVLVSTTLLMLAVPGPDFVLVTRNAVLGGRRRGYRTMAGICAGLAFLTLVTASGLAAVIAASTTALVILRAVGGTYLLLLGGFVLVSAWRRRHRHDDATLSVHDARSPVVQGFLNNVLNPKALVFYLTFMPQFLDPRGAPVFVQTLVMGVLVVVCAATWWTLYITAVGYLRTVLIRASVRTTVDVGAAAALGGIGAVALFGGM